MKKTLVGMAAAIALTLGATSASASGDTYIGYSHLDLGSLNATGQGMSLGFDYMLPLDGENMPFKGLELGGGFDFDYWRVSPDDGSSNVGARDGSFNLLAGYRYKDAYVRGGVGYTLMTVDSLGLKGVTYKGTVGYDFTKKFGINAEYIGGSLTPDTGADIDITKITANFVIKY